MHDIMSIEESIQAQLKQDTPIMDSLTIKEFYADQEIFITGGSGFLGKVLIEKLLRSCPDVKKIYFLLRPGKGKTIEDRCKEIMELPLFDLLRIMNPNFADKIIPIEGDMIKLKLGLSDKDIERLQNVSIVFHSAASVRFDDSLKYAVLMNTRGTREVMEFALTLQRIKVIMHVSTTYSNIFVDILEEKLYPPAADWRKTIEVCEKLDEDILILFTQQYINFMPNTYVFSKNLAEQVSNEYKDRLPIVLLRPSKIGRAHV